MNIVVLGPGAIGALWASHLSTSGHNVSLWGRSPTATTSIQLDDSPKQNFSNKNQQALEDADLLLVTVKAWQVEQALTPLIKFINTDCIILFMHNGMGAVDSLAKQLKAYPVLLATTTHAALKTRANKVSHTGKGSTQIGPYNKQGARCEFIVEVLNHSLPSANWNSDILSALWQKLAINCAINPLTAIEQCKNGDLAEPRFQQRISSVIKEVIDVAQAEGIAFSFPVLRETVATVINATRENYSSMHQDVFYKRKSEIDFITGYLIDTAKHHHIETPENEKLYQVIKQIESSWKRHD
ncbi:2-dehydropantoate 2-reductase [Vibrio lamellibrachiae]|uniref:2-dehydropantoate 2-reductase n=1 Tax=Vibrio lamellibrachiae TaxID=2910253 RepID=UPI003D0A6ECF